jgi:drug/metabolite transporter (DMT)-like permease
VKIPNGAPCGRGRRGAAVGIVLLCAALWGLWWWPVSLLEAAGLAGAWIGFAMSAGVLPVALIWAAIRPGGLSPRAFAGAAMTGLAVALYGVAAYHTDFLRAVLLFYLAPAWSTLIETFFFARRWRWTTAAALSLSLAGVLLITRAGHRGGETTTATEGDLGALGDWLALASGLAWSAGAALIFSSRRAEVARVLVVAALGGSAGALVIAAAEGTLLAGAAQVPAAMIAAPAAFALAALYIGVVLAGTMWGAFRLPPAVMSYLLSVEIVAGVASATLILGEPFGLAVAAGAACILVAALIEITQSGEPPKRLNE